MLNNRFCRIGKESLVVEELADGSIAILDKQSRSIHLLDQIAGLVWRACGERSTLAEISAAVSASLGRSIDDQALRSALDQLLSVKLIQAEEALPSPLAFLDRRELFKTLGTAIPMVTTFSAQLAAVTGLASVAQAATGTLAPTPKPTPRPTGTLPPYTGTLPPRPTGTLPPYTGPLPPRPTGTLPPHTGTLPPRPTGTLPPYTGTLPPRPTGTLPPYTGTLPPRPTGTLPPYTGTLPPRPTGTLPPHTGTLPPRPTSAPHSRSEASGSSSPSLLSGEKPGGLLTNPTKPTLLEQKTPFPRRK
jgi:hypothetical protein